MEQNITKELVTALAAFQKSVPPITKDKTAGGTGVSYTYKYADLAAIISVIRETLATNQLAVTQIIEADTLKTIVMHEGGGRIVSVMPLRLDGLAPQKQGSLITYMRRYSLTAILGIVAEDDDDGQIASSGKSAPPSPASATTHQDAADITYLRRDAINKIGAIADLGSLRDATRFSAGCGESAKRHGRAQADQ